MYTEVFHEIVDILHKDYAGCIDKKGWDKPEKFLKQMQKLENEREITPNLFIEIVRDYILDFQDPHIIFSMFQNETQHETDNGFRTRRYRDKLYVTSCITGSRLQKGDALVSLDGIPIPILREKHKRELMETKGEREDWRDIISTYHTAK